MSLSTILKRILPNDYKTLYQAGYLDKELKITDAGRTMLDHVVLEANLEKFVAKAQEKLDREAEEAAN